MKMGTKSEEDQIKAIYNLSERENGVPISTNALADHLQIKAASVSDMLKKLAQKGWVDYVKYNGSTLTKEGKKLAIYIIRKHRLWETFLVKNLHFNWDEVHEIAEQLEHIKSKQLIDKLADFLGNPKYDPHGDPIPTKDGIINDTRKSILLAELKTNDSGIIVGVNDSSSALLKYLANEELILGTHLKVVEIFDFDNSFKIESNGKSLNLSEQITQNIFIQK
jgi:DtxR family Mn-dependent transcriptional regulator